MFRRELVKAGVATSLLTLADNMVKPSSAQAAKLPLSVEGGAFTQSTVKQLAEKMSHSAYSAPDQNLPKAVNNLDFDRYRKIVFRKQNALWAGQNLKFQVEFFPRGFLYRPKIEMFEVVDGKYAPVPYDANFFTYEDESLRVKENLGYAGLRIYTYINRPDVMEEFCVFLGASYFRAVANGQEYGLSARGFANGTGDQKGEEFALFRAFWIERPVAGVDAMVIHALLDSPSVTGAFRFNIRPGTRPGDSTIFDVESFLYPRKAIASSGIAPLTGMYYFDANNRQHIDDWRNAAHDSEGLSLWTGGGEQIWRPLSNPLDLQFSAFADNAPEGFGLLQRKRRFEDYQDLALHYERRPSLWIEPIGNWGPGSVDLVEIPSPNEVNDNIVAFWRPKEGLKAGQEYAFTYRMFWGKDHPSHTRLARVMDTRIGAVTDHPEARFISIDFAGDAAPETLSPASLKLQASASVGVIRNIAIYQNPVIRGWRTTFEFYPGDAKLAELRCALADSQGIISEQWFYRWTP
ncbi:glucan biosynthesis protein [Entomobacter blattae]|uniref:Glucans biosynthesis protein D n=1 Tax=Entomobacter blattae TaxID=2762277 RepID=A0A7H1NRE5_9PROT|nr:glucan biosynthesis protein G [Entomobacter blattae]QNT78355.1 Glucans biosynthesis protein D [Entomobacter blattae]